jgi:hypothetical protein
MSQVVIRLMGGLGNQMFQYAASRAVADRLNVPLKLDLSWFENSSDRNFALTPFNINAELIKECKNTNAYLFKVFRVITKRFKFFAKFNSNFTEASYNFDPKILKLTSPVILNGYFQSEKYFELIKPKIIDEFSFVTLAKGETLKILKDIQNTDSICVHVRRGDYVLNKETNAYHGTCSLDYYNKAVHVSADGLANPHCFIFSDDHRWVHENLKLDVPYTVVDIHNSDEAHEDLRLMSECKRFVIANSSLSWWGAWLCSNKNKKIIAPKKWFSDSSINTDDLIPSEWIRL